MLVILAQVCFCSSTISYRASTELCPRPCGFDETVCSCNWLYLPWLTCVANSCFYDVYSEWLTHQHRDTLASIIGHPTLASYLAIADGESLGRMRFEMMEVS